ncbi:mechanosensitive ion channel family protein [Sulfurovum sp.]|uniref:mechanosensitive ion channel family protein n=1 Tax=Sulfurovum sp. TaxID=1969726 RepID=UPI0025E42597|nr:mechanosensitive ion channel family protein [Sulfurovum sp.]
MKKLLLLTLLFTSILLAGTTLDTFIDQQMKVEKLLLEQNLTKKERQTIEKDQDREYQSFFLQYATNKKEHLLASNPYRTQISKLKLRLNRNKQRGNRTAVLRDEAILHEYLVRNMIRGVLTDVLRHTENKSKAFYEDKVDEILLKHFSEYKPLDPKIYKVLEANADKGSSLIREIQESVERNKLLASVSRTFSAKLVENRLNIYRTARLSDAKLFAFASKVNASALGQQFNRYLTPFGLDSSKLTVFIVVILFILLIQKLIYLIMNIVLKHYEVSEDDVNYIHSHITKLFNIIVTLFIIQLILVVFFGVDTKSVMISKGFAILYIILFTILIYRSSNFLVHMRLEHIQSKKYLKKEVVNLAIKSFNIVMILIAFILILYILGVDLTAVLSGLGIGGFAVAFAAKDSIANIFGSISILAGDLFEQGDWIEIDNMDGTVVEIGLRATTIRTFDNALISIPNFKLVNEGIKNWSRRSIGRRIKMKIGVTYESDFNHIREAVEEIRLMLKEHPGIANERTQFQSYYRQPKIISAEDFKGVKRTTLVYMDEFADSSINILIYCFSRSVVWQEWLSVKEDVMYKIAEILKKFDLDFAYPAITVHQAREKEICKKKAEEK